ncbi:MAG: hypothetical protein MPK05_07530, partial [Gammaproteobacteria bacterium]|nr:hypothetical protein [Gammaproteobacteria bacterium]
GVGFSRGHRARAHAKESHDYDDDRDGEQDFAEHRFVVAGKGGARRRQQKAEAGARHAARRLIRPTARPN